MSNVARVLGGGLDPGCPPSWADFGRNGRFHPLQGTRRSWLGVLGEKKGFSKKKNQPGRGGVWWRDVAWFSSPVVWCNSSPKGTWLCGDLGTCHLPPPPLSDVSASTFPAGFGVLCAETPHGSTNAGFGGLSESSMGRRAMGQP